MDQFELNVEMSLEMSKLIQTEILLFATEPINFGEIKAKVEECCSIPVCVQNILYQQSEIADTCTTQSLYLRSGDTVHVVCPETGQVNEVKQVVQWLKTCCQVLTNLQHKCKLSGTETVHISKESLQILLNRVPSRLIRKVIFSSWSDPSNLVNSFHFDFLGGVELLVDFHRLLIQIRHHNLYNYEKYSPYLEVICCEAISNFSMNHSLSRRMAQTGGLESCIDSFLMKPADDKSLLKHQGFTVIKMALDALYNVAEIPDVQYELTLRNDVIQQVLLLASSPMSSSYDLVGCMSFLVCLSRCKKGHSNLLKTGLIDEIIGLCSAHEEAQGRSISKCSEIMVLKSYVGVILAQMISGSSHLLRTFPMELLLKMLTLMDQACDVDPNKVQEYEKRHGIIWGTFLPCIEYLYEPHTMLFNAASSEDSLIPLIETLRSRAIDVLLQHLQNSLGRREHMEVLIPEDILDYITLLPWILPQNCFNNIKFVHNEIAKFQQIQPPLLISIAKATLAKSTWGLQRLMNMNSISDLCTPF